MSADRLVGLTEIARRLGISRQRAHVHAKRPDFPRPVDGLAQGRIWRAIDVEKWARQNPRYDHSAQVARCPSCGRPVG